MCVQGCASHLLSSLDALAGQSQITADEEHKLEGPWGRVAGEGGGSDGTRQGQGWLTLLKRS